MSLTEHSEERLRLALDAGKCGVWDWDIAGNQISWTDRLYEIHGLEPGSFGGRVEDFGRLIHPDDAERVNDLVRRAIEERSEYEVEFRAVRPDGEVRWVYTHGRVLYDDAGLPVRMLGATFDITERKRTQEAVEAASRAKDHFLAVLSHELRTPLTPVLAAVTRLEADEALRPDMREALAMIRRNVELEARLIDDLLDLTRIARGKIELRREVTDARQLLHHAVDLGCSRDVAAGRIRLELGLAAGDYRLWADAPRLTQVFWNLLNNAVKFTPDGGALTVRSAAGGGLLGIEVSDTGIGIEPELLPRIFDAFEQAERRITRRFGGLGLGLAVSKAIVEMHGGTLAAESAGPGRGATFRVELPVGELPREARPVEVEEAPALAADLSILLVEDHADTSEALAELLRLLGYRVQVAGSVAAALDAAGGAGIDLVSS
ncbi:MAG: ATP-binding protein, partial [Thermoanaerobaculia bacterium]